MVLTPSLGLALAIARDRLRLSNRAPGGIAAQLDDTDQVELAEGEAQLSCTHSTCLHAEHPARGEAGKEEGPVDLLPAERVGH